MIREAVSQEAAEIRRVHARAWRVTYPNERYGVTPEWVAQFTESWLTEEALARSTELIAAVLAAPNTFYRVAEVDGHIVGFVHAVEHAPGDAEIPGLYVDPTVLGAGIGPELMEAALEWIGAAAARLDVAPYNERAIRFYRRYGFSGVPGSERLFNVMPWVDLSGHPDAQDGLALNLNALPIITMARQAQLS
ncbi:MAG: GNAT family N-acetyltransferase [Bifidobacteriaceae bacterium]|jgi:ribosomal protein S18 acetylase RimI-like enzyme|nr:GNAT family N-acetyltransferase [Bifidobacteriaceae bacterium]